MATKKLKSSSKKKSVSKAKTHVASKKVAKKTSTPKKAVKKIASKKTTKKRSSAKKTIVEATDFSSFLKSFEPYKTKRNEKYMNKNQQKHFEKMLGAWKEALIEEQEKTEQLIQQDQSNFPDSLDRAAKEEEFMLELRKRERERKLIRKIDLSIKDLEDNVYGYCESCGVEIGIKRLEARPTATKCIDCKTVDEIKEKQQFG